MPVAFLDYFFAGDPMRARSTWVLGALETEQVSTWRPKTGKKIITGNYGRLIASQFNVETISKSKT